MTAIEAAKAIVGSGDHRRERDLRVYLIGQVADYVERCLHHQEEKQAEAVATWRKASFVEKDEAAEELLKGVLP